MIVTNPVTSVTSNAATLTVNAGTEHHDAARQSDGERRPNSDVHSGGDRCRSAELSVAEESGQYRRSDVRELHDAGDDKRGQRNELPGNRDEPGHERDEQCGDIDGERGTEHHDAASQSDGERRPDGDVHGGRDRRRSVELSVAEEPGQYRRSDIRKLHDASDDERGATEPASE